MNIYVASSWRNTDQPSVVQALQATGHEVYDFRHPTPCTKGFAWSDIDKAWLGWDNHEFTTALRHPMAQQGYRADWAAMQWADTGVLVMPCGRSAHLEAGYFVGAKKRLVILLDDGEPELMYLMADKLAVDIGDVVTWLHDVEG